MSPRSLPTGKVQYSNKIAKRKAWEEINELFNAEFGEKTNKEKNDCEPQEQFCRRVLFRKGVLVWCKGEDSIRNFNHTFDLKQQQTLVAMENETKNPTFYFPIQPYEIQEKFMKELYFTLENKKHGVFESPTGTGKSLSICCSALQWLKDYKREVISSLEREIEKIQQELLVSVSDNEEWLLVEYEKMQKNQTLATLRYKLDKIKKYEEKFCEMKAQVEKRKHNLDTKPKDMYFCENVNKNKNEADLNKENIDDNMSCEDEDLILEDFDGKEENESEDEAISEEDHSLKVYISSRTHSQLSQLTGEIKRTVFKNNTKVITLASRQHYCINTDVSKLKNINLINERCLDMQNSRSKSTSKSEDGKVIKKTKTKTSKACPFYNQTNINNLKELMLCDIMDMEDLVKTGKEMKACPYYASKAALDDAEYVEVLRVDITQCPPQATQLCAASLFASLRSFSTVVSQVVSGLPRPRGCRELPPIFKANITVWSLNVVLLSHAGVVSGGGSSLRLRDNVLIVDEAHGISAALQQAQCAPLSAARLSAVRAAILLYSSTYSSRLSSANLLALNRLQFVVNKLLGLLNKIPNDGKKSEETHILTLEDFVIKAEIDHLNLQNIVEFCKTSRLARKLHGFSTRHARRTLETTKSSDKKRSLETFLKNMSGKKAEAETEVDQEIPKNIEAQSEVSPGTCLYAVVEFLQMLCSRSEHGRILVQRSSTDGLFKYLLLNPALSFQQLVSDCRSVILAGGTMEPVSEFVELLSGGERQGELCEERVVGVNIVRCGHVVSPQNVLALALTSGPTLQNLSFTYNNRTDPKFLNEVCCILRNICNLVPGGIVCFLTSYSCEQILYDHMKTKGHIDAISKKKIVFREPKSAGDVDQVLSKYGAAVKNSNGEQNGALMMSVIGGKLSEGLNFSDNLCRCVVVFGMPYPNIKSPELQEKMSYLNKYSGPGAGNMYYESLCMKAVNQCIGRAVRHANDYACVLLVDERYSRPHTMSALPSFVQKSLTTNCTFGVTIGRIAKFFNGRKKKETTC
ncbi:unnamed protein product [Diatraea saccharalis]|uniref:Helicase ATP-binding domain-containing protein n=1 Tax=Diatraea saccharalis TaxID=40085 RepID=A0A9N9WH89_9NEOP|nr:unnamed protein product [Diatraea saccharalis]